MVKTRSEEWFGMGGAKEEVPFAEGISGTLGIRNIIIPWINSVSPTFLQVIDLIEIAHSRRERQ